MSDLAQRLGKVIRSERSGRKLSQERLAQLAQVDRTLIYRLEKGTYNTKVDTLEKIAQALQTYPSELLARADGSAEDGEE